MKTTEIAIAGLIGGGVLLMLSKSGIVTSLINNQNANSQSYGNFPYGGTYGPLTNNYSAGIPATYLNQLQTARFRIPSPTQGSGGTQAKYNPQGSINKLFKTVDQHQSNGKPYHAAYYQGGDYSAMDYAYATPHGQYKSYGDTYSMTGINPGGYPTYGPSGGTYYQPNSPPSVPYQSAPPSYYQPNSSSAPAYQASAPTYYQPNSPPSQGYHNYGNGIYIAPSDPSSYQPPAPSQAPAYVTVTSAPFPGYISGRNNYGNYGAGSSGWSGGYSGGGGGGYGGGSDMDDGANCEW